MTEETTPYSTPLSDIDTPQEATEFQVHNPKLVGIDKGVSWIGSGYSLFKQAKGTWVLICIVGLVLMILLNVIPVLGFFMGITTPVWTAGLMIGCKALHDNEELKLNHLFAGFKNKVWTLLGLGVLTLLATLAVVAITVGPLYYQMTSENPEALMSLLTTATIIKVLLSLALLIPVMAAAWFAPPLIALGNVPLFKALKLSLIGCLKNSLPFLIYGILLVILSFIAVIPLGLGYLILVPLFYGSLFTSFKDIYID